MGNFILKHPDFGIFALEGAFSTETTKFRDFRPKFGIFDLNTQISGFSPQMGHF